MRLHTSLDGSASSTSWNDVMCSMLQKVLSAVHVDAFIVMDGAWRLEYLVGLRKPVLLWLAVSLFDRRQNPDEWRRLHQLLLSASVLLAPAVLPHLAEVR